MFRSLTQQVTLAAVCFVGALLVAFAVIVQTNQTIHAATIHLTDRAVRRSDLLADLDSALEAVFTNADLYIRSRQAPDLAAAREAIGNAKAALVDLEALDKQAGTDAFVQALDSKSADTHALLNQQRQILLDDMAGVVGRLTTPDEAVMARQHNILSLLHAAFKQARQMSAKITEQEIAAARGAVIAASDQNFYSTTLAFGGIIILTAATILLLRSQVVTPLKILAAATGHLATSQREQVVPVTSSNEIGDLQRGFNHATVLIRQQRERLELQVAAATSAQLEAEEARAQIAEQLTQIEEQRAAIREMSVPVLPLTKTTLVMPLVGALDSARLHLLQDQALHAIEQTSTRHLLLDITGVPVVDSQVAQGLIKVILAARLLGTEVVLVGIRPEVAQSLVGLGVDLSNVTTQSSLQSGIAYAITRQ